MTKEELKIMIDHTINSNGKRNITGKSLNLALSQIVDCIGEEFNNREVELKRNDVNFFDYDGTLLYAYSWEEAKELTMLPALPEHDGLEVREWNYTLEDIKAQGVDCFIDEYGDTCYYAGDVIVNGTKYMAYNYIGAIDDGEYGDDWAYLLTKEPKAGDFVIGGNYYFENDEWEIWESADGVYEEYGVVDAFSIIGKVDVGACVYDGNKQITSKDVVIIPRSDGDSFRYPGNSLILSVVSFPNTVSRLYRDVIYWSTLTSELKIPRSVKYIATGYAAFADVSMPSFWWNGCNHKFEEFITENNAQRIEIAETFNSIGEIPSWRCSYVKIPKTIYEICYLSDIHYDSFIAVIDFTDALFVPTLSGFYKFNRNHIIVVPDNLYEDWINSSNWSAFAPYIHKKSECPFINKF